MHDLTTLISRVHRGDRQAYGEIVARFQHMAVGYASVQLGDPHLAEDAAQEAFLQAFVDLGQLQEPAAFPGWFRRIVHKHCDRIRRRRRRVRRASRSALQGPGHEGHIKARLARRQQVALVGRHHHDLMRLQSQ